MENLSLAPCLPMHMIAFAPASCPASGVQSSVASRLFQPHKGERGAGGRHAYTRVIHDEE